MLSRTVLTCIFDCHSVDKSYSSTICIFLVLTNLKYEQDAFHVNYTAGLNGPQAKGSPWSKTKVYSVLLALKRRVEKVGLSSLSLPSGQPRPEYLLSLGPAGAVCLAVRPIGAAVSSWYYIWHETKKNIHIPEMQHNPFSFLSFHRIVIWFSHWADSI